MNLNFRIAHWLVVASFPVLVITGFALKFPDAVVGAADADLGNQVCFPRDRCTGRPRSCCWPRLSITSCT